MNTSGHNASAALRYPAPEAEILKVLIHFGLIVAATNGDEFRVRTYLNLTESGLPMSCEGRSFLTVLTALEIAVSQGHMNVVELILAHASFFLALKRSNGVAILHASNVASSRGYSKILSKMAELAYHHRKEVLEIPSIIMEGHGSEATALQHLEQEDGVDLTARIALISSMMAESGWQNANNLIAYVLARAAVEIRDSDGNTALHYSFLTTKLVGVLVDSGADLEAKDKQGRTPLLASVGSRSDDISKELIDRGAKVNAIDNYGYSMLHHIASRRHLVGEDALKMLIDHGADVHAIDNEGRTALHYAATGKDSRVLKILAEAGANVNAVDNNGWSALHFTTTIIHFDAENVVRILIDLGADVNAIDKQGRSVLHLAIKRGRSSYVWDVVKLMIDHGADVHAIDNEGLSALHYAAKGTSINVLETLVERGANVNVVDNNGLTPLHHLLDHGNFSYTASTGLTYRSSHCIRLLLSKGADPKILASDGQTVRSLLGDKSKRFIIT